MNYGGLRFTAVIEFPDDLINEVVRRMSEMPHRSDGYFDEPLYLTTAEAAAHLRCSRQRIYDLTSARQLRVFKDGKRSLYLRSDLDAVLTEGMGR